MGNEGRESLPAPACSLSGTVLTRSVICAQHALMRAQPHMRE